MRGSLNIFEPVAVRVKGPIFTACQKHFRTLTAKIKLLVRHYLFSLSRPYFSYCFWLQILDKLLSRRPHAELTTLSRRSHDALTPLSRRSHAALTPLSRRSHVARTPLSRRTHAALTPISHRSHTICDYFRRFNGCEQLLPGLGSCLALAPSNFLTDEIMRMGASFPPRPSV